MGSPDPRLHETSLALLAKICNVELDRGAGETKKLVEQAAQLKAARPGVRVMGSRHIVKALPWFSSVRARMDDPRFADWFLPFDARNATPYHVPPCDDSYSPPKCSPLYHDQEQTPGFPHGDGDCPGPCDCGVHPCGEYLFNYANATVDGPLADFIVNEVVLGPTGLGNANLSGFYLDDEWCVLCVLRNDCSQKQQQYSSSAVPKSTRVPEQGTGIAIVYW